MTDARCIGNHQRRSWVRLRFCNRLDRLIAVCPHGDLRYIHIAVGHGHDPQVFLAGLFAACGKLRHRCGRRSFGRLTAGIRIHFRVKHQNVDVLPRCQHMVQAAVADVVSPSVAAENPLGALHEIIAGRVNFIQQLVVALGCFQCRNQAVGAFAAAFPDIFVLQPVRHGCGQRRVSAVAQRGFHFAFQHAPHLRHANMHAKTIFGVVFKQRKSPCRPVSG